MPKTATEFRQAIKGPEVTQEVSKARILEAARAHILEDLKIDDLNAITFGLGFSLDVDW